MATKKKQIDSGAAAKKSARKRSNAPLTAAASRRFMKDISNVLANHAVRGRVAEVVIAPPKSVVADSDCGPNERPVVVFKKIGGQTVRVVECRPI